MKNWIFIGLASIFAGLFAIQFVYPFLSSSLAEESLIGSWEVCLPPGPNDSDCEWRALKVPSAIPSEWMRGFQGWLIYRTRFTAPESCRKQETPCVLYFQEIGDAAEAKLNHHVIGVHGQLPPFARYAKHYPAVFQVSRDTLKVGELENELKITVYSMKQNQAGIRARPMGLYQLDAGLRLMQGSVVLNVINPVLGFVVLFILSLVAAISAGSELSKDPRFGAFIRFGMASACFLLSISELPREYLPIGVAGYLHFSLRILHDWAFFELVASFFHYPSRFRLWVRPLYVLNLLAFLIQFCLFLNDPTALENLGRGFDIGFLTLRISVPLLLLPHLMAIYSSYQRRTTWQGTLGLMVFGLTFLFQLHDSAIFHGYLSGMYLVKWYPLVIAAVFGFFFLDETRQLTTHKLAAALVSEEKKAIAKKLAHDIRSPLAALEVVSSTLKDVPGPTHQLLTTSIQRIRAIISNLLE